MRQAPRSGTGRGKLLLLVTALVLVLIAVLVVRLVACSGDTAEEPTTTSSAALETERETGTPEKSIAAAATQAVTSGERDRTATSASDNEEKPADRVVYLTFDDGPSGHTQQILDTLDEYGIKATWFVLGNTGHIDSVSEIWERGHQIGLHSSEHDYEYVYANADNFVADINGIGGAVRDRIGFMPTLIRFPGGSVNGYNAGRADAFKQAAREQGWHYFDWNVSIGDSTQPPASVETLVDNIMREAEGCNSCNVLMHDSDFKPTTPEALPQVIEYFISEGYTFDVIAADSFGYHF